MTILTLLSKAKAQKIGKTPVVILSLPAWKEIEDCLEDLEMMESKVLRKKIAKARSEKSTYSFPQVKKALGV